MTREAVTGKRGAGPHGPETDVIHGALRGTVAAMSMSGMRSLTVRLGLVTSTPPEMLASQRGPRALRRLPPRQVEALMVVAHWAYGAVGGMLFGALPSRVRLIPWAGPAYGSLLWLGFEKGVGPLLGLRVSHRSPAERAALAADHLLYGFVLSELRRTPRE